MRCLLQSILKCASLFVFVLAYFPLGTIGRSVIYDSGIFDHIYLFIR